MASGGSDVETASMDKYFCRRGSLNPKPENLVATTEASSVQYTVASARRVSSKYYVVSVE